MINESFEKSQKYSNTELCSLVFGLVEEKAPQNNSQG
jgi:hypothetical protein